jgi:FkbM family methyltransferase
MNSAQFLMDRLLSCAPHSLQFRMLRKLRTIMSQVYDPLVRYDLAGTVIQLPFSHNLPLYRKLYPAYASNIARIARQVQAKYPGSACIDIGANVGDTAAFIRSVSAGPLLCIEGEAFFFQILRQNAAVMPDVECDQSFVGESSGLIEGRLVSNEGTAHLIPSEKATSQTTTRSLPDILADHPAFAAAKLLKVDTDGYDLRILQSHLDFLRNVHPIIFFEYDPHFFTLYGSSGLSLFTDLRASGYHDVMVYDNFGDYVLTIPLTDTSILEDLHYYYSGRQMLAYCDLCVFPQEDADLCQELRESELRFFAALRQVKFP